MKKENKKPISPKKYSKSNNAEVKGEVIDPTEVQRLQNQIYKAQYAKAIYSWISTLALFSVINSVLYAANIPLSFPIGLGINDVLTGILLVPASGLYASHSTIAIINLCVSLFFSGILFLLGRIFKTGRNWAIYILLVFYSLDTLLFFGMMSLLNGEWSLLINIGFHLYAIYRLIRLFRVYKKL